MNKPASFRLSKTALSLMAKIARKLGVNRTAVIEMALREKWNTLKGQ